MRNLIGLDYSFNHNCIRSILPELLKLRIVLFANFMACSVTCSKYNQTSQSPFDCPSIENIVRNEPLLRGQLSYKATLSLSQKLPLNTGLTVLYQFVDDMSHTPFYILFKVSEWGKQQSLIKNCPTCQVLYLSPQLLYNSLF